MLRVNQLTKQFYSLTALNQLSLRINEGEIVGLLGPNGAGKTTLFKILAGLLQPTKGTVEADQGAWPRIGYKPERPMFPSGMGVAQYLQTCVGLTDVPRSGQKRAVERVLSQVGLTSIANNRIRDCSKGMRQRIGLAQALLGDPQLLILDEPSDGLDPTGQQDIQQLLRQLRDDGVTIVLSSHHLAEVTAVCTRLIILNRGRIAYQKPMQEGAGRKTANGYPSRSQPHINSASSHFNSSEN